MNTLSRHIDHLLLSHECVIVPGIGGFLTHSKPAFYDEEEHAFFPPSRTIGFNPQLQLNDGTLAHSYMEMFGVDYAQATTKMHTDIKAMKQEMEDEGSYHLDGIGTLMHKADGHLEFKAIESGALTPSLFALSRFEMKPLNAGKDDEKVITVKVSTLRRVASAAAVAVATVVLALPLFNGAAQKKASQVQMAASPLQTITENELKDADKEVMTGFLQTLRNIMSPSELAEKALPKDYFTIVLVCGSQPANCRLYADMIIDEGGIENKKLEVYDDRVCYGRYATPEAATEALRLMRENKYFKPGWVKEVHE